jgi:hypothetical protein
MLFHVVSAAAFLLTRDYIFREDAWADVPLIAIVAHIVFTFLIVFPIAAEFAVDYNGVPVVFGELGLAYFLEGLVAIGYAVAFGGYYLYLKLGWFDNMFSGRLKARNMVRPNERRGF